MGWNRINKVSIADKTPLRQLCQFKPGLGYAEALPEKSAGTTPLRAALIDELLQSLAIFRSGLLLWRID